MKDLAAVVVTLIGISSFAATWTDQATGVSWTYYASTVGGGVSVTCASKGVTGSVSVPSNIDGRDVVEISARAFRQCSGLTALRIPNTVIAIGESALEGTQLLSNHAAGLVVIDGCLFGVKGSCSEDLVLPSGVRVVADSAFECYDELRSVSLPSSLRVIGRRSFYGTSLAEVSIPEGVREIRTGAFAFDEWNGDNAPRLMSVSLPSTVEKLGDVPDYLDTEYSVNPFSGCADGCYFSFPNGNARYSVSYGQIVTSDGVLVSGCVSGGEVWIPPEVRMIACEAFALQSSLRSIVIPENVKSIGINAFYKCGLEEVEMQDGGVEVVNGGAFWYCSKLAKMKLPEGLLQIDGYFCGYTPVKSFEIPASVKELYNTFDALTNLNEVVFLGDAPLENSGLAQFYEVPKGAHFKVRLGSRGWDGDPYSTEMPTSGLWPGSYGDYGRPISTYGERPSEWDNGWWTTLDHTMSDDGWTHKDGVWQSAPWKSATYSSDVHTNYVEFTFDEPGVFSCELKLKGQSQNAYAYVVVDGTDMESINATGGSYSGNPTWRHVEYAVDEVGSHTIRVEYRIKNNYYGTEAIAYLQNVSWTPKSAWSRPDYVWTTADNGDGTVIITDVSPRPQYDVEIPAQIGGKRVVGVGDGTEGYGNEKLFYGNTLITSITIPDGVVSIGDNCFSGCYCLKHIFLPSTLTELGKSFASCYSLVGIDIPNGVTEVRGSTFYSCRSLASVILPASVEYIGSYAFEYCSSLSRVTFCGNCPRFGGSVSYIFPQGCVMTVTRGTTGWGDGDIPGVWSGFPIEYVKFTIPQALNNDTLTFVNDACIPWESTFDVSHDGVASVRSGVTDNGQATRIMAAVEGAGTLSFWWKVDSETFEYHGKTYLADMAAFTYDGNRLEFGGCEDWTFVTMKLAAGKHELMWSFEKDDEDDASWSGEDSIWLDEVTWTPDAVAPTFVELAKVFGEDSDVVKNITDETELAAFNSFLRDCSIMTADDLTEGQKRYVYQSFKLAEITNASQLFKEEPVLKIDDIELTGGNLSLTISLTAGAETIQLAKDKLAEKICVGSTLGDITGKPKIVERPSADGTSLTFTITPPEGNQGFVKVLID